MPTLSRTEQVWVLLFIFALVFTQGLTINLTPLVLPTLGDVFEIDKSRQGFIRSSEGAGMLVALLLGGIITQIVRPRVAGTSAVILMGAGALGMAASRSYVHVLGSVFLLGLGTQLILAVHSSVVTDFFYDRRQRMYLLIMAAFAAGASVGPYLFGIALEHVGTDHWQRVYFHLGIMLWVVIAVINLISWRWLARLGKNGRSARGKSSASSENESFTVDEETAVRLLLANVLGRGALYLIGLIVVFDSLAMWSAVTWTPTLVKEEFGVDERSAGFMMMLLAAGVLIGRLLMATFLAGRFSDRKLLGYAYAASMLMFVLALTASSFEIFVVMWFAMGFFMSAQAATTYALASQKFKGLAGMAIPMAEGIGFVGALIGPPLLGHLAEQNGLSIRAVLWLVPVFGLTLTAISLGWEWFDKKTAEKSPHEDHEHQNV